MALQRTSFLAVTVAEDQLGPAIEVYRRAFDMEVSAEAGDGARLTGAGFSLYLRVGEPAGLVLQDFEAIGGPDPERLLLELGCELLPLDGEAHTAAGFLVRDPYGMTFQVVR